MFRSLTLFILLSCIWTPKVSAQTSPVQTTDGCEQIIQAALPRLEQLLRSNDFGEIENILGTIESSCGRNEFTHRIRIIGKIFSKEDSNYAIREYLQSYFDDDLIVRFESAADENYADIYIQNRQEFNYVPLRSTVDTLLTRRAAAILGSEMYELNDAEETILFLFSDHVGTYVQLMQEEIAPPPTSRRQERSESMQMYGAEDWAKSRIGFLTSIGVYTPLNAVNPVFRTSAIFGVGVQSPLSRMWVFDGYLKFRLNNTSREFEYNLYNEIEWVQSRYSFMIGGSGGYKIFDFGRSLVLAKAGIGFESVETGLSEQFIDDWGGSYVTPHTVNTYNLSTGLAGWQHVGGRAMLGLQVQYHYSPYNNSRNLVTPIASDYVSFEFLIRF